MYIYKRFDKVMEAVVFVSAVSGMSYLFLATGATLGTALYLLLSVYFGWLLVRHWRAEFSASFYHEVYRRVLSLLSARGGAMQQYVMVSPDGMHLLDVRYRKPTWYLPEHEYRISVVDFLRDEDWQLEPGRVLSFTLPPAFGYVVADEMVRQESVGETACFTLPQRSFLRMVKQTLLDRPTDNEMHITVADLAYVENALRTWTLKPENSTE